MLRREGARCGASAHAACRAAVVVPCERQGGYGDGVDVAEASADEWRKYVRSRGSVEQDREALAQLIEYDGDAFEIELYEHASDPQVRLIDRAVRSRVGQYSRHLRRLEERAKRTHDAGA
jgi:hypothetical protein